MNQRLTDALNEACIHAHHPGIQYDGPEVVVMDFLWKWGTRSSDLRPRYEVFWKPTSDGHPRFGSDVFSCVRRALREEEEEDRVFALFLLGAFETPEVKQILSSYLDSP